MQTVFDFYDQEEIEGYLSEIESMLRKGHNPEKIQASLGIECFEEMLNLAKARMKNEKTGEKLYMGLEDLRFATHQDVADYRASRLRCETIIDVGCGVGLQSIAFAKTCSKVIAIEVDERKARYAEENFKKLGLKNVELIKDEAIKSAKKIKKADIIFCDTERAAEETERSLETLRPNIKELMKAYSKLTKDFCIEIPPQIRDLKIKCEKEYLSIDGKLNRLDLYFGNLAKSEYSAVSLPSKERVEGKTQKSQKKSEKALRYVYEVDEAVVKAGLTSNITPKGCLLYSEERQTLLTSEKHASSPFFTKTYKVLATCDPTQDKITNGLKKSGAGSVVLRAKVKPEEYWSEKKKYETGMTGNKKLYLFVTSKEALIAEIIS
ncbi:methyltransferase domain-containing protein [Candidatus Woesearchaeota archaeon]|nr:methyltransferase domain-containing protein [Candidatus Woesearchaeota archaeon]